MAHLVVITGHVAPGGTGGAVREPQFGSEPLVDARMTVPFTTCGADQGGFAAGKRGQHTHGMQAVAAEVHERAPAELQ